MGGERGDGHNERGAQGGLMIGVLIAAAVLILDVLSIVDVLAGGKDAEKKAIWIALILFLPLAGPLLYYVLTRRGPLAGGGVA
jgi:hypothetical protein